MSQPTLTIAISALGSSFRDINLDPIPAEDGVAILVLVQHPPNDLSHARPDVEVIPLNTIGVAHSRNAALKAAKTDLLLFADDDLSFKPDMTRHLREAFYANSSMDFACCQLQDETGRRFKSYPKPGSRVTKTNSGRVGTPELALRLDRFRSEGLTFDPNFGAGANHSTGDEYIFVCDALVAGLRGQHLGIVTALHPAASSGQVWDAQSFDTRERVLRRALGAMSWPYRVAFAFKHRSKFPDLGTILRFIKP